MPTTDALTPFPGEIERMRSGNRMYAENRGKGGQADAETVRNGDSFPEMLENMQNGAMDKAAEEGKTSPAKPEGETVDVEGRAALETGKNETERQADPDSFEREKSVSSEDVPVPALVANGSGVLKNMPEKPGNPAGKVSGDKNPARSILGSGKNVSSLFQDIDAAESAGKKDGNAFPDSLQAADGKNGENTLQKLLKNKEAAGTGNESLSETEGIPVPGDKLQETGKTRENGRKEAVFSIVDLRHKCAVKNEASGQTGPATGSGDKADVEMHMFLSSDLSAGDTASLHDGGRGLNSRGDGFSFQGSSMFGNGGEVQANSGAGNYSSFAERLSAEIRANSYEFVRAGQIVLRNGNEGLIRLTLHPESLGPVRIRLEMSGDKKLSGKITVSSREAWDAFEGSMDSLLQSFAEEGFNASNFDLSWSGADTGGKGMEGKISAPFYASSVPDVMPGDISSDNEMAHNGAHIHGSLYAVDVFA